MTVPLLIWGHEAAVAAYLLFAALVATRGSRTFHAALLLIVMLATAAWAQSFVAVYLGYAPIWLEGLMGAVRDVAWLALALALMQRRASNTGYLRALGVLAALLFALQVGLGLDNLTAGAIGGVRIDVTLVRAAVTILG